MEMQATHLATSRMDDNTDQCPVNDRPPEKQLGLIQYFKYYDWTANVFRDILINDNPLWIEFLIRLISQLYTLRYINNIEPAENAKQLHRTLSQCSNGDSMECTWCFSLTGTLS